MPKYHIERSILIDAPLTKVQALTSDFNQWPQWSPWLCMEPDAEVNAHGTPGNTDHGYSWSGELVGAGDMQTTAHEGGVHKMDLTFLRPFKSTAKVELDITSVSTDQTQVTWHMWSSLPFFLFFMTGTIKSMIGMDYERGLKMLKDCAETGSVSSKLEIVGVVDIPQTQYVGVSASCAMHGISDSMSTTMPQINELVTQHKLARTSVPIGTIYNKTDLKNQHCDYTAIIPVAQKAIPEGNMLAGTINAGRALKVVHTGSYRHLGNGWASAMSYQRYKKLKPLKQQPPFEFYVNDPAETAEKDLITEIYIPVRG